MTRYVILKDNVAVNVIEWNGTTPWDPPKDCVCVKESDMVKAKKDGVKVKGKVKDGGDFFPAEWNVEKV